MSRVTALAATALFALAAGARAQTPPAAGASPPATAPEAAAPAPAPTFQTIVTPNPSGTIVANLKAAGRFSTLLKGLDAAGLTAFLQQPGAFTLFAPTDEAFAALAPDELATLLKPENSAKMQALLAYHVVNARITAEQVIGHAAAPVPTVVNKPITLNGLNGTVKVNDATVLQAAAASSNGVIWVIDKVLTPPQ